MSENPIEPAMHGLTKKLGPLPVYAYAVIIVGAAYGVYWYKNRIGGGPVTQGAVTNIGSGMSSAGPMPGTGDYSGAVTGSAKAPAASLSNAQWAKNTADGMIATGSNPGDVNNAIAAYLSGAALTSKQQSVISVAIRTYGNPPEGIVAVKGPGTFTGYMRDDITGAVFGITPDGVRQWLTQADYQLLGNPALTSTVEAQYTSYVMNGGKIYGILANTGQRVWLSPAQYAALGSPAYTAFDGDNIAAPVSTAGHKYVVKEGDTLASVAQANYGSSDTGRLQAANPGVVLTPGTVITIP